jgi:2-isopropylmalate synthase
MSKFNHSKYPAFQPLVMESRDWPNRQITKAPRWCSVDLRDGNQALIEPMNVDQKRALFDLLVKIGFKEIEIGFPAASQPDFDFCRSLIESNAIPDDVTVQVLVQAREALISRTFDALRGCRRAVVHVYNSTSTVQRDKVFKMDRQSIINIAVQGAEIIKRMAAEETGTEWVFQYSPESFTGTEIDYAVEIVDAVNSVWQPTPEKPVIINLPATVEMSTPNVYADQIEYFCKHVKNRDSLIISLHTHNDRGCGVAAAELGLLAGADRVEGTLMGNGERTGNTDLVTMGMNMYSQGVNPELDFSNMDEIIQTYKYCTQLPVHPRHPYAGELVFTAFSGSHQDAIKKCLDLGDTENLWEVAYLPIDPHDIGRDYQEVIRINSQSGKGGVAYVLEQEYGIQMPRWLQIEFSRVVQADAELSSGELKGNRIYDLFKQTYLENASSAMTLRGYTIERSDNVDQINAKVSLNGKDISISGQAGGVVEAFVKALQEHSGQQIVLVEYNEHALSKSVDSQAICYVQMNIGGTRYCAAATSGDIIDASLSAIIGAFNRAQVSLAA